MEDERVKNKCKMLDYVRLCIGFLYVMYITQGE